MVVTALSGPELASRLEQALPGRVEQWDAGAVWVAPAAIADAARFLHDDPALDFSFLNSISAVDFIEYFQVVYHLTSLQRQHTAVVKARVYGREAPALPSVCHVWRGADFQEREIWDLMGVRFEGHPNMKRIMLWEGFEGHPLRKDYL
jgi:NADH:ubiquinone oxidoreductase subunit C